MARTGPWTTAQAQQQIAKTVRLADAEIERRKNYLRCRELRDRAGPPIPRLPGTPFGSSCANAR
jgi:hypothetical protein